MLTSIQVVSGKLSFSLYVGRMTEYFFLLEADGRAPVWDRVTTMYSASSKQWSGVLWLPSGEQFKPARFQHFATLV